MGDAWTDPQQMMFLSQDEGHPLTEGDHLNVLRPQHDVLGAQLSKVTLNGWE